MRNLILGVFADTQPFKILKETFFTRRASVIKECSPVFLLLMEQSLYMALMISHYVQTGIEVKMGTLVKSGCVDTPYIWVPCECGALLLHKRAFLFILYALCSNTHPYTSRDKISTVEIAIKSVPCTLEYSQTAAVDS